MPIFFTASVFYEYFSEFVEHEEIIYIIRRAALGQNDLIRLFSERISEICDGAISVSEAENVIKHSKCMVIAVDGLDEVLKRILDQRLLPFSIIYAKNPISL